MDTIKRAADALFTDTSLGGFPLFKNGNLGDIPNGANDFISLIFFLLIKKRRSLIRNLSMDVLFFLNTDTFYTFSRKSWHWSKITSWLLSAKFSTRSSLFIFFGGWGGRGGADIMTLTSGTQVLLAKCTFLLFGGGGLKWPRLLGPNLSIKRHLSFPRGRFVTLASGNKVLLRNFHFHFQTHFHSRPLQQTHTHTPK